MLAVELFTVYSNYNQNKAQSWSQFVFQCLSFLSIFQLCLLSTSDNCKFSENQKTNKQLKYPTSISVWSWKANLRLNLFSTGVFSSSELSSVGKQRWYKQQGGMDSEKHSSTQIGVSRHLWSNS